MVEYALGIALILVVSMTAIARIQDRGAQRLATSDDRIAPTADNQYYAGVGTTTPPPPSSTSTTVGSNPIHIASGPQVVVQNDSNSQWTVTVTFTIVDASNSGVIGASITGTWSDGGNGSTPGGTCSTSTTQGKCTLQFTAIKDNVKTVTFTTTSVSASGSVWQPAAAGEGNVTTACSPPLNSNCD
jgi:hypothetical protein